jgi:ABC-type glycerol-3-phosphate transport system substrate-binding protein
MIADYEKASGNKIDFTIVPNEPLRQKEVSAITSGVVPDVMEVADFRFAPLNVWDDKVPELAKSDPFWFQQDAHRAAHGRLTLLGPRMPLYEIYNPATAQYNAEHAFSIAEYDVMKQGMAPEAATDKAFKRAEEIFAKYPITRHKNVPRHRRG